MWSQLGCWSKEWGETTGRLGWVCVRRAALWRRAVFGLPFGSYMGGLHSALRRTGPPSACPVHSHSHLSSRDMTATGHDTGPVRSSSFFASDSSVLRLLLGCSLPVSLAVRYILSCLHGQTIVLYVPFGWYRLFLSVATEISLYSS